MKTDLKQKKIQREELKAVNSVLKPKIKTHTKLKDRLPSWKRVVRIVSTIIIVVGAVALFNHIHGYSHHLSNISIHAKECADDPTAEKCIQPIVDASKAGKDAVGIVNGVTPKSIKD